ncbi:MT-A70-domain-containing protein [Cerioporus squamosus]|nr:MT-A70-domain-containing protein [Cerioporus squamosus]
MMATTECLAAANELLATHSALVSRIRNTQRHYRRQLKTIPSPPNSLLRLPLIPTPPRSPSPSPPSSPLISSPPKPPRPDLPPAKRARVARYNNYVPEEETIRNDYSQRYVDGGEWPQDWVLGADPEHRFEEYPKQQRLLALKKAAVAAHALPPTFLPYSELSSLQGSKFDIILIDPPFSSSFTWEDLQNLPIPALSADPSFVLLWVGSGSGEGLERGREVMAKWGFRRCEDIVWVKTNKTTNKGPGTDPPTTSLLTRTKQHCLMGIRGTVRRSTDSWFVHCNVDTDVLIWEGDASDPTLKPPEMYTLIENFCLGLRRLEIFGRARTARRGWVTALAEGEEDRIEEGMTLGEDDGTNEVQEGAMRWNRERWEAQVKELAGGSTKLVVPVTPEIDALRPKSPVRGGSSNTNAGMMNHSGPTSSPMQVPMSMTGPSPGGMGGGAPGGRGGFGNQNRMMGPPMVPMNNMAADMGGMGMMGWSGDMGGMGLGINVGGMGMNAMGGMNGMNGMNPMGMGMSVGQQGMVQGFGGGGVGNGGRFNGGFDGGMGMGGGGMGWMGNGEGQFMDATGGGMWDGGMGGGMGDGMMGMNGMNGMNNVNMGGMRMGMNSGMNSGMGSNMMGMGMSQWNGEGFEGGFGG